MMTEPRSKYWQDKPITLHFTKDDRLLIDQLRMALAPEGSRPLSMYRVLQIAIRELAERRGIFPEEPGKA